jgi:hypothetical protein
VTNTNNPNVKIKRIELNTMNTASGLLDKAIAVWMKTKRRRKKRQMTRHRKYL